MTKRLSTRTLTSEIGADLRSRLIDNNRHAAYGALKAAIDNLDNRFFFVGLHERFAESACVLANMLNAACYSRAPYGITHPLKARTIYRKFINTNRKRTGTTTQQIVANLPASIVKGTLVAEKLDLLLYEYASRKFESLLKQHPECTLDNLQQRDRKRRGTT